MHKQDKKRTSRGFTLLEILLIIATIGVLAAIVIMAINPSEQMAKARNSQRRSDIKNITNAVYQYSLSHGGTYPGTIDSAMRAIGTATSGCDIICGAKVSRNKNKNGFALVAQDLENYFKNNFVVSASSLTPTTEELESQNPQIVSAEASPIKVWPGDILTITAEIKDASGIKSVEADMGGIETIKMELKNGTEFDGVWEVKWKVHDTQEKQYLTTITVIDKQNLSSQKEVSWIDPPASGWVSPSSATDTGNQWSNEAQMYDGDADTYGQNDYGGTGWGDFIVFNLSSPILSNRVRVNADYTDAQIAEVDVDVYVDGAWVDVYQGGSEALWNCQWVELPFTQGTVTQARFRYNYISGGYFFWLYEFQFYENSATIVPPTCSAREAISIQEESAILQGLADDDGGEPAESRFEYGTTASYGSATAWSGGVESGEIFSSNISGLTNNTTYHFRGQLKNSAGTTNCPDTQFTTSPAPIGWVLPYSSDDPGNGWENEMNGYDNNTATNARSYHPINAPQWSEYLYISHSAIKADKIKFYARAGSEVDSVDVEVYKDGSWENVYEGSFADRQWVEKSFSEGIVTQARIRFHATYANHGFFWELYEIGFYKTSVNTSVACVNLEPFLVSDYVVGIPTDPKVGSAENTHYAIRKDDYNRITVYSCDEN